MTARRVSQNKSSSHGQACGILNLSISLLDLIDSVSGLDLPALMVTCRGVGAIDASSRMDAMSFPARALR